MSVVVVEVLAIRVQDPTHRDEIERDQGESLEEMGGEEGGEGQQSDGGGNDMHAYSNSCDEVAAHDVNQNQEIEGHARHAQTPMGKKGRFNHCTVAPSSIHSTHRDEGNQGCSIDSHGC